MTAQDIASNGRTTPGSMPAAASEPAQPAGQSSGQREATVVLTEAERADRRRAKKQRQKAARAAQAAAQEPEPTQAQVKLQKTFGHSKTPLLIPQPHSRFLDCLAFCTKSLHFSGHYGLLYDVIAM